MVSVITENQIIIDLGSLNNSNTVELQSQHNKY